MKLWNVFWPPSTTNAPVISIPLKCKNPYCIIFTNANIYLIEICSFLVLIFFFKFFLFNFFLFDFLFKVCSNDPIIAFYNFFWITNFTVLPFICIIFLIQIFFFKKTHFLLLVSCSILILYLSELDSFFSTNLIFSLYSQSMMEFNFFLTNSLNKYHPFVLYESVVLFFLNYTFKIDNIKSRKKTVFFSNVVIFLNLLALFLGAWWAAQEGSWGGWWNWDPSETLGLLIFGTNIVFSHFCVTSRAAQLLPFFFSTNSLFFFLVTYFFVQLNFETTSHNFGIKFFFFFNNNFFLFEIISCLFFLIIFNKSLFNFYFFTAKFVIFKIKNLSYKKIFSFVVLAKILIVLFYLSFSSAINFFCYNVFFFIVLTNETKLFFLFYLFLFLFLFQWQLFKNVLNFILFFFLNKFFIFFIHFKLNFFFSLSHYILFLALQSFFLIEKFNYSLFLTTALLNETCAHLHQYFQQCVSVCVDNFCVGIATVDNRNEHTSFNSFFEINLHLTGANNEQQTFFSIFHFLTNLYLNFNYSYATLLVEIKHSSVLFIFFFWFLMINFVNY